jgi:imidazole glycerol-phosphate synthase subunit HisH
MTARQPRVAIIDYGMGNRRSVFKALERVGGRPVLARAKQDLLAARGMVIPGVGAFPEAMKRLGELELIEPIRERALEGMPLLGICLGMQLLLDRSQEMGDTAGLGLIPGRVTWLAAGGLPVPHIGWSEVELVASSPLTDGLPERAFYHVHSLAARPESAQDVIGLSEYGERFATILGRGRVFGVQFHPEKSSFGGLALLERFAALCRNGATDSRPSLAGIGKP